MDWNNILIPAGIAGIGGIMGSFYKIFQRVTKLEVQVEGLIKRVDGNMDGNAKEVDKNISQLSAALILAAREGDAETVQYLLAEGANINTKDFHGRTALMEAIYKRREAVIQVLLKRDNIDVNIKNNNGETILMKAAEKGCSNDFLDILFVKGADVNAKTQDGRTALMEAAFYGNKNIVEKLLGKGAKVNEKNNAGESILKKAEENEHTEIVGLLKKHSAIE